MKDHPLTPMTDANLVRVLQRQSTRKVGLVQYDTVAAGADAIRARFAALRGEGVGLAIVDAVSDADLHAIGAACTELALVTGGSGVAIGLPDNFRARGLLGSPECAAELPAIAGAAAVLSGSCSVATNGQVAEWLKSRPGFRIDPIQLADGKPIAALACEWAAKRIPSGPVLIYATANPQDVKAAQARLGAERAGQLVETCLAEVAQGLVGHGVRRLVIAGGETSGAVVQALGVTGLRIGPQIDPGVPWTMSLGEPRLLLALKSGNFGAPDFFARALGEAS
jgi:3-dehydrotetronate 4-kinase